MSDLHTASRMFETIQLSQIKRTAQDWPSSPLTSHNALCHILTVGGAAQTFYTQFLRFTQTRTEHPQRLHSDRYNPDMDSEQLINQKMELM